MQSFDDSDMKIAVPKSERAGREAQEETGIKEQLQEAVIDRAKEAGDYFSGYITGFVANEEEQLRIESMALFSYLLNHRIKSVSTSVIAYAVLNQFYDSLKAFSEELYQQLQYSVSYSLYLLCGRRDAQPEEYAEIFAKACGESDTERGERLYRQFDAFIGEKIAALNL